MNDTPIGVIDEFLQLIKEAAPPDKFELKKTQKKELELWHSWNTGGRKPDQLKPLMDSYKPMIEKHARKWRRNEIPSSAINNEFKRQAVNAFKSFDPAKGAQLNTWVQTNLQKASRYVKIYQNMGKMPEQNIAKIRKFQEAKFELSNKLGFEPDTHQIADHLGWPKKRVEQLNRELRKDLPASGFKAGEDPTEFLHPKELEAIRLIHYDLTPEEKTVYEYTFGMNGKPSLKPGSIAIKTGIHPSKISRIRNKLQTKVKEAVELL